MAFTHGKDTVITVDGSDISTYCNTSTLVRKRDSHDVTGYGANGYAYSKGLTNSTFSCGGTYDNTAAGPHDVIAPLWALGNLVEIVRQPEGAGSGLPQETFDVLITDYVETNPVADMVSWSMECQVSGDITPTNQ